MRLDHLLSKDYVFLPEIWKKHSEDRSSIYHVNVLRSVLKAHNVSVQSFFLVH